MGLEGLLNEESLAKLEALDNAKATAIVEKYVDLCKPSKVTVLTDSEEDIAYIRELSVKNGEERSLAMTGHTIHFDGIHDQARDKSNTKVLVPKGGFKSDHIATCDRDEGLEEILQYMDGAMAGKEMLVLCFTLGPKGSDFSIAALQLTDSAYVTHSESILYRAGYEEFKSIPADKKDDFFYFIHSAGAQDERGNSKDLEKRRIYIDLQENRVLTVNNQYGGNSIGLKKLAMRLAIQKSSQEGWLCEHMFVMGAKPEGKDRVTYFTGAFPSACGKTSTAMIPGQLIVGDDIAYIKMRDDGQMYAANVEQGIFGIIQDVNEVDDPIIHSALTSPREVIFSNVLVKDDKPYWLGMGQDLPKDGENYSGEWTAGKTDAKGNEILPAHRNARYTIRIQELENADPRMEDPQGVPVSGVIYGGRDSDTNPPVLEAFDWAHGVYMGASIESETTAATLGKMGVRKHSPMANLDFLVVPLGSYVENHLNFGEKLTEVPKVFATNYFLKEDGRFLNEKVDKKIWLLWMEGRVHDEYEATETPVGWIPNLADLQALFKQVFDREYTQAEYEKQFAIRVVKLLERLARIEEIYAKESEVPQEFMAQIVRLRGRLEASQKEHGMDVISPLALGG